MSHADLIREAEDVASGLEDHGSAIGASYMRLLIGALQEEQNMIARMRGALRVNALRAGATHREIDAMIAKCRRLAATRPKADY